ncbi:MAG: hypothetical protein HPY51_19935 [Candidatus Omnitrophica bacterium]|nr:hypothetical protein [Candidatus Omnitrophota bacterium]
MTRRRFLRDHVIDDLIGQLEQVQAEAHRTESSDPFFLNYLNALLVAYKTCMITLERIEEGIESARKNDPTGEICLPLVEAATHIQTGVLSLHETFLSDTGAFREQRDMTLEELEKITQFHYPDHTPPKPSPNSQDSG